MPEATDRHSIEISICSMECGVKVLFIFFLKAYLPTFDHSFCVFTPKATVKHSTGLSALSYCTEPEGKI